MYFEFVKFLTILVCVFSLIEQSLSCGNRTRQKRDDGPDFVGMAALAIDLVQPSGGFRNNFKVKFGNENLKPIYFIKFAEHK